MNLGVHRFWVDTFRIANSRFGWCAGRHLKLGSDDNRRKLTFQTLSWNFFQDNISWSPLIISPSMIGIMAWRYSHPNVGATKARTGRVSSVSNEGSLGLNSYSIRLCTACEKRQSAWRVEMTDEPYLCWLDDARFSHSLT